MFSSTLSAQHSRGLSIIHNYKEQSYWEAKKGKKESPVLERRVFGAGIRSMSEVFVVEKKNASCGERRSPHSMDHRNAQLRSLETIKHYGWRKIEKEKEGKIHDGRQR